MAVAVLPLSSAVGAAPAPASAQDTKKARELFAAAQGLYQQKRFAEAIEKFEAAYAVKPHPVIHYNIGRCYEELGKTGPAVKSYKTYLRLAPEAKDRNQVADTIASLERKLRDQGLQQLTVVVEPPEATVEVDAKAVGPSPATVEVTIGTHHVVASLDGYEPFDRSISVTPGQASELNVSLVKREPKPAAADAPLAARSQPEPSTSSQGNTVVPAASERASLARKRLWTYVVGGVAVAGLGTGIGLWLGASAEAATYTGGATINGVPHQPWPTQEEGMKHYNASMNLATGAFVAYGIAAAAAITAVVLYFLEPSPKS